jgi:hypothetical protein
VTGGAINLLKRYAVSPHRPELLDF